MKRHVRVGAGSALVMSLFVAIAAPAMAQTTIVPAEINTRAGTLRILPSGNAAAAASQSTFTGTFLVTVTTTLKSAVPTTQPVSCAIDLLAVDAVTSATVESTATVTATRSAATATCNVGIPYAWTLSAGSKFSFSYTVTTAAPTGVLLRSFAVGPGIGTRSIPANGATTKLAANVVL